MRRHVELTFQNFIKFLWKHVFKLRKKRNPWMFSQGGWSASICLAYSPCRIFIIKPCCKAANEAIRKLGMIIDQERVQKQVEGYNASTV